MRVPRYVPESPELLADREAEEMSYLEFQAWEAEVRAKSYSAWLNSLWAGFYYTPSLAFSHAYDSKVAA